MTKENLYIPANRSTNDTFRDAYEKISWDNEYPEEIKGKEIKRKLRKAKRKLDAIGSDVGKIEFPEERIYGHFS